MGNCFIVASRKCPWPLKLGASEDAKYQFDPERDITIEPQKQMPEMQEVDLSSNSDDVELEIESGQRISIENSNFTRIDDIQLDSKDKKEMDNRNIKKLSMTKAAADGDKSKRMTDLSDVDLSTDIDDEIQEDVGEEDNESLSKALSIEQKGSSQQSLENNKPDLVSDLTINEDDHPSFEQEVYTELKEKFENDIEVIESQNHILSIEVPKMMRSSVVLMIPSSTSVEDDNTD